MQRAQWSIISYAGTRPKIGRLDGSMEIEWQTSDVVVAREGAVGRRMHLLPMLSRTPIIHFATVPDCCAPREWSRVH